MGFTSKLETLFFILIILFCSCSNKNEQDLYIELPIASQFIPASIEINKTDLDDQERQEIMNLVNNIHVINDISELPNDPIGQNEAFYNINYNEYTLLIMYIFKIWNIDTYSNSFYRNTQENSYNWVVRLGTSTKYDPDNELIQFTRFAILVRKLPIDADVKMWHSFTFLGS